MAQTVKESDPKELNVRLAQAYKEAALAAYYDGQIEVKKHSNNAVELVFLHKAMVRLEEKYQIFYGILAFGGALHDGILIPQASLETGDTVRLNPYARKGQNIYEAINNGIMAMAGGQQDPGKGQTQRII